MYCLRLFGIRKNTAGSGNNTIQLLMMHSNLCQPTDKKVSNATSSHLTLVLLSTNIAPNISICFFIFLCYKYVSCKSIFHNSYVLCSTCFSED